MAGPPSTDSPLAGIRVVEHAAGLGGAFAGFLLAGLGADVVRFEPPGTVDTPGDRVVQRGKRRAVLVEGAWAELTGTADVVLTDEVVPEPAAASDAVRVRITGWGAAGHPKRLPPAEPLLAAAGAAQTLQWSWARRPVWIVAPIVSYMTGLLGALGAVSGVYARLRGASGRRAEVSGVAAALALNSGTLVTGRETRGSISQFGDPRGQIPTYSFFRSADGWLFIGALTEPFLMKLMTLVDRVDLLADPRLEGSPLTFGVPEVKSFVRDQLDPIIARRTTAEWLAALRAADLPCGAVQSHEEALNDPEARAAGVAVPLDDPVLGPTWQPSAPAVFSDTPAPPPRAAARPGGDPPAFAAAPPRTVPAPAAGPRPWLEGIRVLDLASFIAGPFCPMLLADLGADVVKVEPLSGDPFRLTVFGFTGWNRGKRSLAIDLKHAEGRRVFLDLARGADVVVDNFRAGVMERLGIGWETLSAQNPRLVHTSITGYGSSGPLAGLPAFDPVFQARSGLAHGQGGGVEPVMHMIAYNDYCAGTLGALATVAALVGRERTGRGQRVDVSLFRTSFVAQAAAMVLWNGRPAPMLGGRDYLGPSAARRLYPCTDGWLCVDAETPAACAALARLAGVTLGAGDPVDGPAAQAVERLLAPRSRRDAADFLAEAGVPAEPCRSFDDVFADPWLRAGGWIVEQPHPLLGPIVMSAPFVRTEAAHGPARAAPLLGADGAGVLAEIGYSAEQVEALVAAGIVFHAG